MIFYTLTNGVTGQVVEITRTRVYDAYKAL